MDVKRWELAEGDVVERLRALRLEPSADSPLAGLVPSLPPGSRARPLADRDLSTALTALADPVVEVGLLLSPPFGAGLLWFFRGAATPPGLLVSHYLDGPRHVLTMAAHEQVMAGVRGCLDLDGSSLPLGLDLDLTATGFQALLALLDGHREQTLQSLLERIPGSAGPLTARAAADALTRSLRAEDLRWLGAVAQQVTPMRLGLPEASCARGFEELRKAGLVDVSPAGWLPAEGTPLLSASLGTPVSYGALRYRNLRKEGELEHYGLIRGQNSLWLLEFDGIDAGVTRVRVRGVPAEELELVAAGSLHVWAHTGSEPPAGLREERICPRCASFIVAEARFCAGCGYDLDVPPPSVPCRHCGHPLADLSALFCPQCGQRVAAEPAPLAPAPPAPRHPICPNPVCGEAGQIGGVFCPRCGTRYDARSPASIPGTPEPARAAAAPPERPKAPPVAPAAAAGPRLCDRCRAPLKEGKRFCTSCGTPTASPGSGSDVF